MEQFMGVGVKIGAGDTKDVREQDLSVETGRRDLGVGKKVFNFP